MNTLTNIFEKNNPNFLEIDKLRKEYEELHKSRFQALIKIKKLYEMVFKGMSHKRVHVEFFKGYRIYASRVGILYSRGDAVSSNIYSIVNEPFFIEYLYHTGLEDCRAFRGLIKQKELSKLKKFLKDYKLLKEEPKVMLELDTPIQLKKPVIGFKLNPFEVANVYKITLESAENKHLGLMMFDNVNRLIDKIDFNLIDFSMSGLKDKIYIEQTFKYIKQIFEKEIRNEKKEINGLNAFYEKIKANFSDYLLLEAIERED